MLVAMLFLLENIGIFRLISKRQTLKHYSLTDKPLDKQKKRYTLAFDV